MESRLTNLEVRQAFQDDLLESLNRTVADQQQQIDMLREQLRIIYAQLKSISPSPLGPEGEEPPPPHY